MDGETPDVGGVLDWPAMWRALAVALRVHLDVGRRHLLTEDVVRFATVMVLADHGVTADRLSAERTVQGVGRIDLFVDAPSGTAVEFKFPREPSEKNAADTMAFGETLKDFYRLAHLDVTDAWAVQLLRPSFVRYLNRRAELDWKTQPGEVLVLPAGLAERLPVSASAALRNCATGEVRAHCHVAEMLGDDMLLAFQVQKVNTPAP